LGAAATPPPLAARLEAKANDAITATPNAVGIETVEATPVPKSKSPIE
jgi:hypothetical protein